MNKRKGFRSIRCLALTLVLLAVFSVAAFAENQVTLMPFETTADSIGLQRGTQLTVGTVTQMSGHFGTECFSLNTADMDVRSLLHGYTTVAWTRTLGVAVNSAVIAGLETTQESDGGSTYTFTLHDDLRYCDGTRITAKDYVFSVLLNGSPALTAVGGTPLNMNHLTGYEAYARGSTDTISGVRLLSDLSFSLRVSKEYLPFFYGLSMLNITPYPIAVIAPGYDVGDDGSGAYLQGAGRTLTADMLRQTLMDPQSGYEFNPKVTTGPYRLEVYDSAAKVATFVVNEQFKGNYEGAKPHIERLIFRQVDNATAVSLLENGEVDLLNKITNPQARDEGTALMESDGFAQANYLRTGLAYLSYACEEGPTASAAVRMAISLCMDMDAFTAEVAGSTARRVYGYYGLGQWMISYTPADGDPAVNVQEELDKLALRQDVEAAKQLLIEDGWTLDAAGGEFVETPGAIRYRMGDEGLEPLIIKWAKTQPSETADQIEQMLAPAMAAIGMRLEATPLSFDEVLTHLYRQAPRTYHMFFLSSNFSHVFDPYYDFHVADTYQGVVNTSGLRDAELMRLAQDMRETVPTDLSGYIAKWLAFQGRFVELMPMTPLYSSVYFDFYTASLQDYAINQHPGWGYAILYAHLEP